MPAHPVLICQRDREHQQNTCKGHSLERKTTLLSVIGVCAPKPTFCTVPPPSANLHLKTQNQIEGCECGGEAKIDASQYCAASPAVSSSSASLEGNGEIL